MSVNPNGVDARDIALHFVDLTGLRVTPRIMQKTIGQAKTILMSGYSKDEVISALDFAVKKRGIDIYSLGYITASINDLLREIKEEQKKDSLQDDKQAIKELLEAEQLKMRQEVSITDESTERNRNKAGRVGVQSGVGKKYSLDMFEGQRQDN